MLKKEYHTKASNYHPVYLLTSIGCKILMHVIHANIMDHIEQYQMLSEEYPASERSCESQLIQIVYVHDLVEGLDNRKQTDMSFNIMVFSKAFDLLRKVAHHRLLLKIQVLYCGNAYKWIHTCIPKRIPAASGSGC